MKGLLSISSVVGLSLGFAFNKIFIILTNSWERLWEVGNGALDNFLVRNSQIEKNLEK